MKIGDKIEGRVIKITIGRDNRTYITVYFEGFGNATLKEMKQC